MAFQLGDIYIGQYPITQDFGANPQIYEARYGLKGHNGIDIACPTGTMIVSAANGKVSQTYFDPAGYGNYVVVNHDGYATLYAHLNDYQVKVGDILVAGQLIGHSNSTGNSTGPHLHFGVKTIDSNGNKTQPDNGYSGYVDPMGSECVWNVKNLTAPVTPITPNPVSDVAVPADEFTVMVGQGANYKLIANFALANGLNEFLTANQFTPIDMTNNPGDPDGGKKLNAYISDLLTQIRELKNTNNNNAQVVSTENTQQTQNGVQNLTSTQKTNIFNGLMNAISGFIFEK